MQAALQQLQGVGHVVAPGRQLGGAVQRLGALGRKGGGGRQAAKGRKLHRPHRGIVAPAVGAGQPHHLARGHQMLRQRRLHRLPGGKARRRRLPRAPRPLGGQHLQRPAAQRPALVGDGPAQAVVGARDARLALGVEQRQHGRQRVGVARIAGQQRFQACLRLLGGKAVGDADLGGLQRVLAGAKAFALTLGRRRQLAQLARQRGPLRVARVQHAQPAAYLVERGRQVQRVLQVADGLLLGRRRTAGVHHAALGVIGQAHQHLGPAAHVAQGVDERVEQIDAALRRARRLVAGAQGEDRLGQQRRVRARLLAQRLGPLGLAQSVLPNLGGRQQVARGRHPVQRLGLLGHRLQQGFGACPFARRHVQSRQCRLRRRVARLGGQGLLQVRARPADVAAVAEQRRQLQVHGGHRRARRPRPLVGQVRKPRLGHLAAGLVRALAA